jgi:hypothetical protein
MVVRCDLFQLKFGPEYNDVDTGCANITPDEECAAIFY